MSLYGRTACLDGRQEMIRIVILIVIRLRGLVVCSIVSISMQIMKAKRVIIIYGLLWHRQLSLM